MKVTSLFAALSIALAACADEPTLDTEQAEASALVAPKDGKGRRPAPPRSCEDRQDKGFDLADRYQACSQDADCKIESVAAPCLAAFLCPVSVARDADVTRLSREAARISLDYRRTCGDTCPVARCASPEFMVALCNQETKRCYSRVQLPDTDPSVPADEAAPDASDVAAAR